MTFTFNKAPTDFSLNDVRAVDGSLSNLSGSGTTYTATFTANAGVDDNAATVSVINGSYHDADGNAGTGASTMSPVNFSSAVATFYEVQNDWAPSQMIDGIFTGPPPSPGQDATYGGVSGWSVYDFNAGMADGADALLTLATPLPAGQYNLTFRIYQNYYGNPGHILGDFALDYTTDASATLSSPQTPVSSSLNGTTFSLLSPGELLANTSQNSIGTDTYTISALVDSASPITGIFLDAIKNPALPGGGPGGQYGNGNFVVSEFTLDAGISGGTAPFTVDTTPPATPAAPTDASVVNGYVNRVNDTPNQVLTGTAENGSTVTVYDNNIQVGSTTADATTGFWSFPIGVLPDDSAHSYTVTATDAAGNVSQQSAALSSVVDTDPDEQAALKLTVGTTAISAATAALVPFTIAGLELEDAGTVTFTDVNQKTVVVNVTGRQTSYTANLSSLADGTITSSLAVSSDPAGNTFTPVLGNSVTLTQLDHWTNVAGGNWTNSSSWTTWNGTHAVPTGTIDAVFDTSGTYTVNITTADTAYALLLNNSGTTVADTSGGTLTLTGTGGLSNPNGTLAINAGVFTLNGGALKAGAISITSGGELLVSASYTGLMNETLDNGAIVISGKKSIVSLAGNISGSSEINIQNGAAATFNGAITGSEAFTITDTSNAIVNTTISGSGSFALLNSGSLEFGAADSENVTFMAGANGSLTFDHSLTAPFTGSVSGLSPKNAIILADLTWTPRKMTATFSGDTSGGTLTVSNGTNSVALKLLGDYTTASWKLSKDNMGGTRVVDPPVTGSLTSDANNGAAGGIDLSGISFDANTTLAYSANGNNSGGNLTVSDGLHAQTVALLGQYMASSFVMASDGHGGTMITDPPSNQQPLQIHPHG